MKFIKKYYLLLLLIITLAGATIYGTYAMFTSSVETNMVNMDTYMNYTFDINGTQELKVSAGSKLRFNAIVKNSMDGTISYGLYYKMINPTTLPSGVIIAQVSDDLTVLAKGQLESGTSKTVPMVIKNTSDSEITVEIGVRTGYATASQGVDDIIYNEGEIPITSFQTNEEAGNDSCTSTKTCTNECIERIENGYKNTYCYCLENSIEYIPPAIETITNIYNTAPKTQVTNNGVNYNYATSVGMMEDIGGNIRYYGADPNNYVSFNDELWRIIGVFKEIDDGTGTKETRIKIARSESIGNYLWDNKPSGTGSSASQYGSNEWSDSALMNVLNNGAYYNRTTGTCPSGQNGATTSCDFSTTGLTDEAKNMISDALWNLGGSSTFQGLYANDYYTFERGTTVSSGRSTTWTGKIALMYPSDYMYAGDLSKCSSDGYNWDGDTTNCRDTSWLRNTSTAQWTLTPFARDSICVFYVDDTGYVHRNGNVDLSLASRPVLFLKSNVQITGGDGSQSNPFTLSVE